MDAEPVREPTNDTATWPTLLLDEATAQDVELARQGAYPSGPRFLDAGTRAQVSRDGRLPDGTPWVLPLGLPVSAELAASVPDGGGLLLVDAEAVPLATMTVTEAVRVDREATAGVPGSRPTVVLAGPLSGGGQRTAAAFARLRRPPASVRAEDQRPPLVVLTERPLHCHDVRAVEALGARSAAEVRVLALTGAGRAYHPDDLLRALLALGSWPVLAVPVPAHRELAAAAQAQLVLQVAQSYGARRVLVPGDQPPWSGAVEDIPAAARDELPQVGVGPPGPVTEEGLRRALDAGSPLPAGFTPPAVEHELRRARPPLSERGFTVLFTGLSGSGKSTIAQRLGAVLTESGERRVTSLDGDVVRTLLSSGLSFSRAHRELNVRRIGYVAAEVTRHGGIALAAPIAPYADVRADVRRMVTAHGEFVLVHVATPLAVCEARDRKGLYAKARAGLIPEFTGISDPYEVPADADLSLDTSTVSLERCVHLVLDLLASRGLLPIKDFAADQGTPR